MSRPWWAWWAGPGGTGWRRAWPPPAPPPLTHNDKLKWMLNARVLLMISSTILGTSLRMAASWTASVILDSDLTTQCHLRPSTSFIYTKNKQFIIWDIMSLDLSSWSPRQSSLSSFSRTRDDPSSSSAPALSSQTRSPRMIETAWLFNLSSCGKTVSNDDDVTWMGAESADRGHHNIHYNQKHILKHLIIINWWMLGGCKVKRKIKGIYYSTRQRILGSYWSDSESWERAPRRSKIKIESFRQIR